jgi:hypothetical protein
MRRRDASEVEKLFFVVVGNRATIAARSFLNFRIYLKIKLSNFSKIEICKFSKIENFKFCKINNAKSSRVRSRKTAKRNQGSTRADRLSPGKASRAASTIAVSTVSLRAASLYYRPVCPSSTHPPL